MLDLGQPGQRPTGRTIRPGGLRLTRPGQGRPAARRHGYSGGNWSRHNFYPADGNGNGTALVNSSGVLQASYKYDPYGRYLGGSGTLASANVMRFSSKPWVGFTGSTTAGLYAYGYRFYDPYLQRWVNRDPIEERGGINLYRFCENSPTFVLDPDGWGPLIPWILKKFPKPPINPPSNYFGGPWSVVGVTLEYAFGKCTKKICEYARLVGKYDEFGYPEKTSREVGCCDACPMLDVNSEPVGSYADPFPITPVDKLPRTPWTPLPQ